VKPATSILLLASFLWANGPDLDHARKLYQLTEFERSVRMIQAIPEKERNGAAWELLGKNYYGMGDYKKATDALDHAIALEPENSGFLLWMGRAFGRRAETSSMITAPGYASKARQYFERAAQANPKNLEAQSDLFEYYLEAPGFLGGGQDKAAATASDIARISPAEGYWAQAKLAEKRKEYSSAEQHLRQAIEVAPHQIGRFIDLAKLLVKQGRIQEADQSIARAEQISPNSPKLMFAKADLYIRTKRNLPEAKELLKRYLSSTLSPDDPPRSQAEKLLKQM
jgi:cytochrome c-type biogenesis protein CcmH/NrfG